MSSPRSMADNFLFPGPVMLPVIRGKDVVGSLDWDKKKLEKPEIDLFDTFYFSFLLFIFSIFYLFLFSKLLVTIL